MNYVQLKTQVENVTGTNTETGRFLNEAQLVLAKESKKRKKASIAITAGVATIPAGCLVIRNIKYGSTSLGYSDLTEDKPTMGVSTSTTDTPGKYALLNSQIIFNTSVTVTDVSNTCILYYTPRPATMVLDTDIPELTDADTAMVYYARWRNYLEGEDVQEAGFWENEWYKKAEEWIRMDSEINNDLPFQQEAVW